MGLSALSIDFYELTMAQSFFEHKLELYATFDLLVRRPVKNRSYFLAAGLRQILEYLENFSFDEKAISFLKDKKIFKDSFLDYLKNLRFSGCVSALPEGTVFFPGEPVLRVSAPIIEAQLVESQLLNTINISTVVASKASRVVSAAKDRGVFDFSLRRTQGQEAGLIAARSSYIAGCLGTSNVLAGFSYGIPVVGTMAHSFVMSFKSELDSFKAYVSTFPEGSTLLVDTYDYIEGIGNAIKTAKELESKGYRLKAIRLDSGDLVRVSRLARKMLDSSGLDYVKILASGNLDEFKIEHLLKKGAAIDSFGVGTQMGVSADAPYLDVIYKLCEVMDKDGLVHPVMKLSQGKITYPGKKQVFRVVDKRGFFLKDILALEAERVRGEPLLVKVIEAGKVIYKSPQLNEIRENALQNLKRVAAKYKGLRSKAVYPVTLGPQLKKTMADLKKKIKTRHTQLGYQ